MAYVNSADPDKTAPVETVGSGSSLFCHSIKYFKKELHNKHNLSQKSMA